MGGVLAERLVADDRTVYGNDVDETAIETAVEYGVVPTSSIPELVSRSEIVLSSLPGPDAATEAYLGDDGIVTTRENGLIALETSTIDPETTRDINAAAAESGIRVLEAPVSGGIGRAEKETLTVMVGGAEAVFEDPGSRPCWTRSAKTSSTAGSPGLATH